MHDPTINILFDLQVVHVRLTYFDINIDIVSSKCTQSERSDATI